MVDLAEVVDTFVLSDHGRPHREADSILATRVDRWWDLTQDAIDRGWARPLPRCGSNCGMRMLDKPANFTADGDQGLDSCLGWGPERCNCS